MSLRILGTSMSSGSASKWSFMLANLNMSDISPGSTLAKNLSVSLEFIKKGIISFRFLA